MLEASSQALQKLFEATQIDILCKEYQLCRSLIPGYRFFSDYEYAQFDFGESFLGRCLSKVKRKLFAFGFASFFERFNFLETKAQHQVLALYQQADLIISSPGGYLHDHYGYLDRLKTFELLQANSKPVILLAQSIGPFWKKNHIERLKKSFDQMMAISVREAISLDHLKKLKLRNKNIFLTTDHAFLLFDKKQRFEKPAKAAGLNLVVCFRRWSNEKETADIISKAIQFCTHLLEQFPSCQLTFLSTCQGIEGYVKDSLLAEKIVAQIPDTLKSRCIINRKHHHPRELIEVYSTFDAYLGMRLHGAILSMIGQTPAFNIGYELKSQGIYHAMGLSAFQISYQEGIEDWIRQSDYFLATLDEIREGLPSIIEQQHDIALDHMQQIKDIYQRR